MAKSLELIQLQESLKVSEKLDAFSWLDKNYLEMRKSADSILKKNTRCGEVHFSNGEQVYSVLVPVMLDSKTLRWFETYIKPEESSNGSINLRVKTFDDDDHSLDNMHNFSDIKGKNVVEKVYSNWTWSKVFSDVNDSIKTLLNN